jgi:hypothetical protein
MVVYGIFAQFALEFKITFNNYEARRGAKRTWPTMTIKSINSILTLEATLKIASDGFGVFAKIYLVSRWLLI